MKTINSINPNINNLQCSIPSRELRNGRHVANNPVFGSKVIKENGFLEKSFNWLGEDFSSAMQRFVSGVTAILTQPFIDWNNKNTDEETRKTSCARILGKIIAGTATGVSIRWACVKLASKYCKTEDSETVRIEKAAKKAELKGEAFIKPAIKIGKKDQLLLPKSYKKASYREVKNYRGAIGTLAAVVIMIATNFLVDAPLTTYLTNVFVKQFKKGTEPSNPQSVEGGK